MRIFLGGFCLGTALMAVLGFYINTAEKAKGQQGAPVVAPAQQEEARLKGVYIVNGREVKSFTTVWCQDGSSSDVPDDGSWDMFVMVNPKAEEERVFFNSSLCPSYGEKGPHFFYRDQLKKITVPVFEIKNGAQSYAIENQEVSEDGLSWPPSQSYFIGPQIDPKGATRVYISKTDLPPSLQDGKRHFFNRQDLRLVNPESLE